jgi:glycosyltransferase involved in cell wall biosynthesis
MKVAVLGLFPDDPARIVGGVEAATLRLCEGLHRVPGVDVHTIVSVPGRAVGLKSLAPNWTVHSIGTFDHFGNVLLALPDRMRMVRALRALRPDIVHAHSTDRHALGALDSGFPTVVTIHGVIEMETRLEKRAPERIRGFFRDRMVKEVLRRVRNVAYVSSYLRDLYEDRLRHAQSWIIENPVGDLFFRAKHPEEPGRVLYAGLLIPRKGLRNLLAAVAIAKADVPEIRLALAGSETDASYRRELERKIDELGIRGCVEFLGGLSPERLAEEYGRAAIVVLVSRQDTSPVAIQEAMAAGRPMIGSTAGGIPYLVKEGITGFLVPYGEPALLARKMVELIRDPVQRRSMGQYAQGEAYRRFSVDGVAGATYRMYNEILSSP